MELLDGPGTLETWLLPRLKTAQVVGIRTGWLSASGVAQVRPHLVSVLERGGEVTIVANVAADLTDGEAARSLAELTADFPERAAVCLVGKTSSSTSRRTTCAASRAGLPHTSARRISPDRAWAWALAGTTRQAPRSATASRSSRRSSTACLAGSSRSRPGHDPRCAADDRDP